jgi:capsular polysaccharide biosynthesis protein
LVPRKLAEALFRNLWVLILPIVIVPALILVLVKSTPVYESAATVWVAQPDGIDPGALTAGGSVYKSPAENQVQVFYDLLSTRAFRIAIAEDAKLIDASASRELQDQASDYVATRVAVSAEGNNLIAIRATGATADDAYGIANAVISQYQARAADETGRQATIAVSYYTEQLNVAQAELDSRQGELAAYIAANPALVDPATRVSDAGYIRLNSRVESQTKVVDGLNTSLQDVQLKAQSAPQSLEAVFNVQDAPTFPQLPEPASMTKKVGYPFAGLLLGALISASYLYLVFRMDQTIRTDEDLAGLELPLLGYVPEIQKGPGAGLWQYTPFAFLMRHRARGYARRVAASIASLSINQGGA